MMWTELYEQHVCGLEMRVVDLECTDTDIRDDIVAQEQCSCESETTC